MEQWCLARKLGVVLQPRPAGTRFAAVLLRIAKRKQRYCSLSKERRTSIYVQQWIAVYLQAKHQQHHQKQQRLWLEQAATNAKPRRRNAPATQHCPVWRSTPSAAAPLVGTAPRSGRLCFLPSTARPRSQYSRGKFVWEQVSAALSRIWWWRQQHQHQQQYAQSPPILQQQQQWNADSFAKQQRRARRNVPELKRHAVHSAVDRVGIFAAAADDDGYSHDSNAHPPDRGQSLGNAHDDKAPSQHEGIGGAAACLPFAPGVCGRRTGRRTRRHSKDHCGRRCQIGTDGCQRQGGHRNVSYGGQGRTHRQTAFDGYQNIRL